MAVVSLFFKLSMSVRDLHNYLVEEIGMPSWASYSLFAGVTLGLGCILGFVSTQNNVELTQICTYSLSSASSTMFSRLVVTLLQQPPMQRPIKNRRKRINNNRRRRMPKRRMKRHVYRRMKHRKILRMMMVCTHYTNHLYDFQVMILLMKANRDIVQLSTKLHHKRVQNRRQQHQNRLAETMGRKRIKSIMCQQMVVRIETMIISCLFSCCYSINVCACH